MIAAPMSSLEDTRLQSAAHGLGHAAGALQRRLKNRPAAAMIDAFNRASGLVHGDEMARLLRRRHSQPLSLLARWIVSREIVTVPVQGQTLIPLFQFDMPSATPHASLRPVLQELCPVFTDWELAMWFASPNTWLANQAPVAALLTDACSVVRAAQMDRYAGATRRPMSRPIADR